MSKNQKNIVSIEWHFKVSPEKIWQAWTDPALVRLWFGSDPDGKVLNVNMDVFAEGHFEVTFTDSDETKHTCSGFYTDIKRNTCLKFTWSWKNEPGLISLVNVLLNSEPEGTLMNFDHTKIDPGSEHDYESGWRSSFKKLEHLFETGDI